MNQVNTQQQSANGLTASSTPKMRLSGSRLIIARVMWLALVIPGVGLFVAGVPAYYNQLQTACVGPTCNFAFALNAQGLRAFAALGVSTSNYAAFITIFLAIDTTIWCGIGFLIFWRRSDDWLALLSAFFLVMFNITFPGSPASALALAYPVLNVPTTLMGVLGTVSIVLFFLLFPNGRFVPRWMGLILLLAIIQATSAFFPPTSPFNSNNWPNWFNGIFSIVTYGAIIFSQIYRYRSISTPVERQQTKWVIFSIITVVTGFIVLGFLISVLFPALYQPDNLYYLIPSFAYPLLLLMLPLSIGIAILRYRLWDIDRIINRTLVYGLLTGTLASVYFILIFALQFLARSLTGQVSESPVVIVASTLAIYALFNPLRHRIQAIIDRRFYRRKYDAARTLAAFSTTLRDEVDLSQLREHLLAVVQETMQPAHVSLWLRKPDREVKR